MKKIIYHGSKNIIEKPIYGYGKKYNDYGLGFYCTFELDLAKEWAVDVDSSGYANKYEIEIDDLKILNLNEYTPLHWLAILLENRTFNLASPLAIEAKEYILNHFLLDYRKYDVIIGYRADDSYFAFARDFVSGVISYQQLIRAMKLGDLGQQFVLISKKAFESICFLGAVPVEKELFFQMKSSRDLKARESYYSTKIMKRNKKDLYVTNIIDKEIKENDPRL